jgi:hypothetical protein
MGFASGTGLTGQGSIDLGGLVTVNEVAAHLEVAAEFGTITGVSPVRRTHKQAFYCIGLTPSGGPLTGIFIVTFAAYLQVECESHPFATGDHRLADTLYYDIAQGCEMYLEVDWD